MSFSLFLLFFFLSSWLCELYSAGKCLVKTSFVSHIAFAGVSIRGHSIRGSFIPTAISTTMSNLMKGVVYPTEGVKENE